MRVDSRAVRHNGASRRRPNFCRRLAPVPARRARPVEHRADQPIQRRAEEWHRIVPRQAGFCFAVENPAQPRRQRHTGGARGRIILPQPAPRNAGFRRRGRRPFQSGKIGIDQRRNVDPGDGARMMPKIEPRIDFEEPQFALRIAFEVELGDAGQRQLLDDGAAALADVAGVGDFQRRGMAVGDRLGADFAAGELAGDAAVLIDVAVIAFDPRSGPVMNSCASSSSPTARSRGHNACRSSRFSAHTALRKPQDSFQRSSASAA